MFLNGSFSSALAYTSRPYSEAMGMCLSVTYTPCATSSREQTVDIITFAQFDREVYYLKLVMMQKAVMNPMTIQECHPYLAKNKFMHWILAMNQIMILHIRRC